MPRILILLLAAASMAFISSCTSDKPDDASHTSSIPWNRPESWEGQGPMGNMMGTH